MSHHNEEVHQVYHVVHEICMWSPVILSLKADSCNVGGEIMKREGECIAQYKSWLMQEVDVFWRNS